MIRPAAVLALLVCAALSGCGTMNNVTGRTAGLLPSMPSERPTVPFGGVVDDAAWMARCIPPDQWSWMGIVLAAADTPLSLAGDIITLPYTVPYWLIHGVGQPAASDEPASKEYQFSDLHFVIDPPPGGHLPPDRVHGGVGPGY